MKHFTYLVAVVFWIFGVAVASDAFWMIVSFVLPPVAWIIGAKWLVARYL